MVLPDTQATVTIDLHIRMLWRPIAELEDKYLPNLLVYAPELVDEDFNPSGAGMAHFQDGGLEGDVADGQFLANKWNGTNDEWMLVPCTPTHFIVLEPPRVAVESIDDGVDPTTRELMKPRGNDGVVNTEICAMALMLVGDTDADDVVAGWDQEELDVAYDWAVRAHLSASDNDDVYVPPRPHFVPHRKAR